MSDPAESPASVVTKSSRDGVVSLTLDRPEAFNALSSAMLEELQRCLDEIAADPGARVVVLGASGKAFCAGHDLRQMHARPDRDYYEKLFARSSTLMKSIVRLPVPVIARVHGMATAAGCQLIAACDLAVASESAKFAVSGINVGLFCSTPSVPLSRNVPRKRAFEMLITGDFIDAGTAADWGLVNRVVADDRIDAAVAELAGSIRDKPPAAVTEGKRMFYRQLEMGLDEAYEFAGRVMADNLLAEDAREGVGAFLEKRPPAWKKR